MSDAQFPALDLNKILTGAQLPALPQSAIRLLELSQDPNNGPAEFAVPIESDPGLAGQVLRFVNSSYFGFSREISSVKLAITLVGIRTIKNFSLWSAVFSLMPNPKCGPFDLKSLWQDSLRRALFARAVAKMLGVKEVEEPFSAALLQDMAVPLLAKEASAAYVRLLNARQDGKVRLSVLERHVFGWTHAEAAGIVARMWNLPEAFAVLIEGHLEIDRWVREVESEPARLSVALSAMLPTAADRVWADRTQFEQCYESVCPPAGPSLVDLLGKVDEEYADFAPVLKLTAPSKSLTDYLEEEVAAAG
jgi:HD-like signal output (HDOD) protein